MCREPVSSNHRKRKKLHGRACQSVKQLLGELAGVGVEIFPALRDQEAVLCSNCEVVLKRINKLENDKVKIEEEIMNKKEVSRGRYLFYLKKETLQHCFSRFSNPTIVSAAGTSHSIIFMVQDRVNPSKYSDKTPPFTPPDPSILLPSETDLPLLKDDLIVLMSR